MPKEGDIFGPYRLVRQIAVGGMAEIYLAKSEGFSGFEKFVALKMIHSNFSSDQHFVRMLVEEAKITVFLNHVNIAQIFDLGRIGNVYYIAMEFIDGADLYHIMRSLTEQGLQMPPDVAAHIMHEVCAGLDYAHRCRDQLGNPLNIIHRDISPQNILISHAGEVKIVDFGIAKAALRARQTAVGVIKGKYYYMSPQQAWGEPLDHRTDIFSAGVVLYEILAGQMLYLEDDVARLLDMVRRADIPLLRTKRRDVPRQLEAIAMKAVAKEPDDRWSTAHELQQALHTFLYTYAPRYTVQKLQMVVHQALAGKKEVIDEHEATGSFSAEQLMGRRDFSSFSQHSVLFSSEEQTSGVGPPPILASDDGFEQDDKTVVSGPPSFVDSLDGDPALPLLAESLPQRVSPPSVPGSQKIHSSSGWSTEEEEAPTKVLPGARARSVAQSREEASTIPRLASGASSDEEEETKNIRSVSRPRTGPSAGSPLPSAARTGPSPSPMANPYRSPPAPGGVAPPSGQGVPGWAERAGYGSMGLAGDPSLDDEDEFLRESRARTRRVAMLVVAALVLVAGVIAILVIFGPFNRAPTTGEVQVITEPSGAQVECDGEPQHGLTPGVVITGLSADQNHTLYIEKPGYRPSHKSFTVEPGKRTVVRVKLEPKESGEGR